MNDAISAFEQLGPGGFIVLVSHHESIDKCSDVIATAGFSHEAGNSVTIRMQMLRDDRADKS
jgi:hypothetical protein